MRGESGDVAAFPSRWVFLRGVPSAKFLPPEGPPEIAFAGRSNVGKSSLLNALTGQKGLARTSNTPGRTQELNFFVPEVTPGSGRDSAAFTLVDMPGYGFARAPKEKVDAWTDFIFSYVRGRTTLKRVFLLIDSRHGIKAIDTEVMDLLDRAAVSYQVVLTKADKIRAAEIEPLSEAVLAQLARRGAAYPAVLVTSSEKRAGMEGLRAAILAAVLA